MGIEIERKFLVKNDDYEKNSEGVLYRQGYICNEVMKNVRVRVVGKDKAYITIKGRISDIKRLEYEYEISAADAEEMLDNLCEKPLIEKIRYKIDVGSHTWEVDKFLGDNEGLVIAEIELENQDTKFLKPEWVGEEVTNDSKYLNAKLIKNPYKQWVK